MTRSSATEHVAPAGPTSSLTLRRSDRLEMIRQFLLMHTTGTVEELQSLTGVSRMTVHRDLDELASRGVLHRTRGGASVEKTMLFEAAAEYRMALAEPAKLALARAAAEFVEPGQVLMLDESTTSYVFYRELSPDLPVTVVSNFLPTIQLAASRPQTHLIALGGDFDPHYQAFFGFLAEESLAHIHADLLVSSSSAIRGRRLYHQSQLVIGTRQAMHAASVTRALLVDSSKLGNTALYAYGSVQDYDHLFIDDGLSDTDRDAYSELGSRLHIAPINIV